MAAQETPLPVVSLLKFPRRERTQKDVAPSIMTPRRLNGPTAEAQAAPAAPRQEFAN